MKVLPSLALLLALSPIVPLAAVPAALPDPLPPAPEPIESVLRLQIFLDAHLFGPGKIDGRPGDFTAKALRRYQRAQGLPETEPDEHTLDLSGIGDSYTTYTIREEDLKFVGDLPSQPSAQSRKKYLPYDSLLEFLTERFHCSPELLQHINLPKKMSSLAVGDVVKVPNVKQPFQIEDLSPIATLPEQPEFQSRVIKIDTVEKILELHDGDRLLASLPITPGSGYLATPPGTWRIVGITQLPTFRWDKSMLDYGVRSENAFLLPIGPNNPVGVMWIGLNKPGIGIHGTNSPQTIGRSSSHGCMRTANWDVVRLVPQITKGMTVMIEGPAPVPRPRVYAKAQASQPVAAAPTPAQEPQKRRFNLFFWRR
jgi:lipoprotein-anchoring transpeptidase ErfK/SrfK